MLHFCTYFDHRYLSRGLALYRSLESHCPSFRLWILCLDRVCYDALSSLSLANARPIPLGELEKAYPALLEAKRNRSLIEYYFTCTPALPLFVFDNHPDVSEITYLDSDVFFFSDPNVLFEEIAGHSVAIIGHRFPQALRGLERFGVYNVGWLFFRRDPQALACLRHWREQCLAWCYDRVENGRYADQKYLDEWPSRFRQVAILEHKGANLAPWNLTNYDIIVEDGRVLVDRQPLVFYHFHGLKQIRSWLYDPFLAHYKAEPSYVVYSGIYEPYLRALSQATRQIAPLLPQMPGRNSIRWSTSGAGQKGHLLQRAARGLGYLLRTCQAILTRRYIVIIHGRVLALPTSLLHAQMLGGARAGCDVE